MKGKNERKKDSPPAPFTFARGIMKVTSNIGGLRLFSDTKLFKDKLLFSGKEAISVLQGSNFFFHSFSAYLDTVKG